MKDAITKVLMLALILLLVAGILSLSVAIFVAGLVAVAGIAAYVSIRRWWLRHKGVNAQEASWPHAFDKGFPSADSAPEPREENITIIEVEYEEVKKKDTL